APTPRGAALSSSAGTSLQDRAILGPSALEVLVGGGEGGLHAEDVRPGVHPPGHLGAGRGGRSLQARVRGNERADEAERDVLTRAGVHLLHLDSADRVRRILALGWASPCITTH